MKLRLQHTRTSWSGTAAQYLVGRNHRVRRLRLHLGQHNLLVALIPKGVRVKP